MNRPTDSLTWQELFWDAAAGGAQAVAAMERIITASELGTVALELRADASGVRWLIGCRGASRDDLSSLLAALLPLKHSKAPARRPVSSANRLEGEPSRRLFDERRTEETSRALLALSRQLRDDELLVVQVLLGRRLSATQTHAPRTSWWDLLTTGTTPRPPATTGRPASLHGVKTVVRCGVVASTTPRRRHLLHALRGALRTGETSAGRLRTVRERPEAVDEAVRPWRWPLSLASDELAGLTGWPIGDGAFDLLGGVHPRLLSPSRTLMPTDRIIGTVAAPGPRMTVGIPIRDAAYHAHLLAPTGSGKSTVMLSLIRADMNAGRGVMVIDPKGDLIDDILTVIPHSRRGDVVLLDPTSPCPVRFNPLVGAQRGPELVADTLLATFKSIFAASWGVRTEDILTACFTTLARTPGASLVWLPALLTQPTFRQKILAAAPPDPLGTDAFWARFNSLKPEQRANEIAPCSTSCAS